MKIYIYIIVGLTLLVGCKKDVVTTDAPEDNVRFGVTRVGESVGNDVFENGDQLAVYMIDINNDANFVDFKAKNFGYQLNDAWQPIDVSKTLKWKRDDNPVFFYAYSPVAKEGEPIFLPQIPEAQPADTAIAFKLPINQSEQNSKKYDLLRAVAKGESEGGLTMENSGGNPVKLSFYHMLSKIKFNIVMTRHSDVAVLNDRARLKRVRINSKDIASEGVMSLKTGALWGCKSLENQWVWEGDREFVVTPVGNATAEPVGYEFIVTPFVATEKGTWFEFEVVYNVDANTEKTFVATYVVPVAKINFLQGKKTVFNTTVSLSNEVVGIDPIIVDWDQQEFVIDPVG